MNCLFWEWKLLVPWHSCGSYPIPCHQKHTEVWMPSLVSQAGAVFWGGHPSCLCEGSQSRALTSCWGSRCFRFSLVVAPGCCSLSSSKPQRSGCAGSLNAVQQSQSAGLNLVWGSSFQLWWCLFVSACSDWQSHVSCGCFVLFPAWLPLAGVHHLTVGPGVCPICVLTGMQLSF